MLSLPGKVYATGAGGSVITTDVRYGLSGQTSSLVAQKDSYYVTNTISGAVSTLYNPFSYVYFDKSIFAPPVVSDVTLASGASSVNIINTDPNYYIVKINYSRLSTDFVSSLFGYGYSGPANTANGGVSQVPSGTGAGMDKRKVEFKITLPATAVWDPSLPNNSNRTYNSADRTITQVVDRGLGTVLQPPFSLKWDGNQPVTLAPTWTKITMQQVTTLVNDDGTLDNSTRRSGELYYHVSYVRRIRIKKTLLEDGGYLVPRDADYKYNYLVSVDQFGGTRPQTASSVTFRMIEDEP